MSNEQLAAFVRLRLEELDLKYAKAERLGGLGHSYISKLLKGQVRGRPKLESVEGLAKALRVPRATIMKLAGYLNEADVLVHGVGGPLVARDSKPSSGYAGNTPDPSHGVEPLPGWRQLPVYGPLRFDEPVFLDVIDHQLWPADVAKDADAILIVRGDSMAAAGIIDGDVVFVQRLDGHRPSQGEMVIARIGDDFVCRRFRVDDRGACLEAFTGARTEIGRGVELVARVVGMYRDV